MNTRKLEVAIEATNAAKAAINSLDLREVLDGQLTVLKAALVVAQQDAAKAAASKAAKAAAELAQKRANEEALVASIVSSNEEILKEPAKQALESWLEDQDKAAEKAAKKAARKAANAAKRLQMCDLQEQVANTLRLTPQSKMVLRDHMMEVTSISRVTPGYVWDLARTIKAAEKAAFARKRANKTNANKPALVKAWGTTQVINEKAYFAARYKKVS